MVHETITGTVFDPRDCGTLVGRRLTFGGDRE
jgi:hypothetical protein